MFAVCIVHLCIAVAHTSSQIMHVHFFMVPMLKLDITMLLCACCVGGTHTCEELSFA